MALENANLYRSVETKALELERMKAYTENIIESINVAVLALDLSGRITSCNRAFEKLYETTRMHIVGSPVEKLLQPDVLASIQKIAGMQGLETESPVNIFKMRLENQRGRSCLLYTSPSPRDS